MKTLKMKSILALIAIIGFGLVSCENLNGPTDTDTGSGDEVEGVFTSAIEMNDLEVEGGFEEEFEIEEIDAFEEVSEDANFEEKRKYGRKGRKGHKGNCKGVELRGIMGDLDLTDEQKDEAKVLLENTKECSSGYFESLRETTRAIVEPYNEQRNIIIESVRAGDLTKEDAKVQLEALRMEIKSELDANADVVSIKESIAACRDQFKVDFAELLTLEQLELWNTWLAEKETELG